MILYKIIINKFYILFLHNINIFQRQKCILLVIAFKKFVLANVAVNTKSQFMKFEKKRPNPSKYKFVQIAIDVIIIKKTSTVAIIIVCFLHEHAMFGSIHPGA